MRTAIILLAAISVPWAVVIGTAAVNPLLLPVAFVVMAEVLCMTAEMVEGG